MNTKIFEIRDAATFIVAIATRIGNADYDNDRERYLLRRSNWAPGSIVLTNLQSHPRSNGDVYEWGDRTMQNAHNYIEQNWDDLESGAVICVETILGLRTEPIRSEDETVE